MSIQHFFNFLIARGYIERAPFCVDYYLKKVVPKHNDRMHGFLKFFRLHKFNPVNAGNLPVNAETVQFFKPAEMNL